MDEGTRAFDEGRRAFQTAIAADLRQALVQANRLTDEAAPVESPSVQLKVDLWPPIFLQGSVVHYEVRSVERLQPGDYLLARHQGAVAVCRFLDWAFDGEDLRVVAKVGQGSYRAEAVRSQDILGLVTRVRTGGREFDPNQQGLLDRLSGLLGDYGTSSVPSKLLAACRALAQNRREEKPERRRAPGFLQQLVELTREELRRQKEEQAHPAPVPPVERPIRLPSEPTDLLRNLGYRGVGSMGDESAA